MKMNTPRRKVAMIAPAFVFMCVFAQRPNACEPPDLLIRATRIPRSTRKMKIPELSATAAIRPSDTAVSTVPVKLKPELSIAPITRNKPLW